MPGTLPYSGARYPLTTEADTVPADLLRFGTDIDQLLVLKATSQADRDAEYANVSGGTLVSCASLGILWQKKADGSSGGWRVLSQSTDGVTSGVVTPFTNWSINSQWAKTTNGFYSITCSITYNGTTDIVGNDASNAAPGNIVDVQIATLATPWPASRHPCTARSSVSGCSVEIRADGTVWVTDLPTSGRIRVGDVVTFNDTYPI